VSAKENKPNNSDVSQIIAEQLNESVPAQVTAVPSKNKNSKVDDVTLTVAFK
jgi:hypothetical protein